MKVVIFCRISVNVFDSQIRVLLPNLYVNVIYGFSLIDCIITTGMVPVAQVIRPPVMTAAQSIQGLSFVPFSFKAVEHNQLLSQNIKEFILLVLQLQVFQTSTPVLSE